MSTTGAAKHLESCSISTCNVSHKPSVSIEGVEVPLPKSSRSPRDTHQHAPIAAEHCETHEHHRVSMHLEDCNISTCNVTHKPFVSMTMQACLVALEGPVAGL